MLGDSILVMIGMLLIALGVQPMLIKDTRKDSVAIINSTTLVIAGIFILFYWNTIE